MVKLGNTYQNPDLFAQSRKTLSTRKAYSSALRAFARHVNIPYESLHTYLESPQIEHLTTFASDRSKGTQKAYRSIVTCWLQANDVEISRKQADEIKVTVRRDDKTQDMPLTVDIIRKMCDVSNLQGRTLFITLLCTGCRIEELLLTELRDVDLDRGVICIRGDITKTKNSRHVVLSLEAINILKMWLQERPAYLVSSTLRGQFERGQIFRGEGRKRREIKREDLLFPFTPQTARSLFATAIRKVFNIKTAPDPKHPKGNLRRNWGDLYDADTGRGKLHIHSFRGTFRMQLRKGMDTDLIEILMGHVTPLGGAYRQISTEELIAEYRKAEEHITVYATDSLKQQLLEATSAEAKNRADIAAMQAEIDRLHTVAEGLADIYRNPEKLIGFANQYLLSRGMQPIDITKK